MPLHIYNTLDRKKELFVPLDPAGKRVTMYNCGPTVYDHFHIGNARNFVVMDIARRYLEWSGYEVKFVQNLTDIDDKIIERANNENRSTEELTDEFTEKYYDDASKLGVRKADAHPRATEYVDEMIAYMKALEAKDLAYASRGSLYFRVRRFDGYGKLSGRSVDDMMEGARVDVVDEKDDPLDFVLWKAAKPGEPTWDSPWGKGRPGWHSECAVMAHDLLGETIDIHSGGMDLMFPHHENEIAQHEGLYGKPFARYWLHNGFLNIDSEKMSKSLGNFFKIDEVLGHGYAPEAVRAFLLSAAYRHPLDYNDKALDEAASAVKRINEGIETGEKLLPSGVEVPALATDTDDARVKPYLDRFREAMDDDFNTPRAIAVIHDLVSAIHETRQAQPFDADALAVYVGAAKLLRDFFGFAPFDDSSGAEEGSTDGSDESLGPVTSVVMVIGGLVADAGLDDLAELLRGSSSQAGNLDQLLNLLIEARKLARKSKAFDIADAIRDQLAEAGFALEDHPQGTIWKKI